MLFKTLCLYLGLSFCIIFIVVLLVILSIAILYRETKRKMQDNIEIRIKLNLLKLLFIEFSCKVDNDK